MYYYIIQMSKVSERLRYLLKVTQQLSGAVRIGSREGWLPTPQHWAVSEGPRARLSSHIHNLPREPQRRESSDNDNLGTACLWALVCLGLSFDT